jgi:hypothetical protein
VKHWNTKEEEEIETAPGDIGQNRMRRRAGGYVVLPNRPVVNVVGVEGDAHGGSRWMSG